MSAHLPLLASDRWKSSFSRSDARAGTLLADALRVRFDEWMPAEGELTAIVIGSRNHLHNVLLGFVPDGNAWDPIEIHCDCRQNDFCAHAYAVLHTLATRPAASPASPSPSNALAPSSAPIIAPPPLDRPVSRWIDQIAIAFQSQTTRPAIVHQIRYTLIPSSINQKPFPSFCAYKVRLRNDGSPGRHSPFTLGQCLQPRPPQFVTPADVRLAQMVLLLLGRHGPLQPSIHLDETHGADLLPHLLATGRCHWIELTQPPLQSAKPRPAQPTWSRDPNGCLRTSFSITPPASDILPLAPPWFVDVEASKCGSLKTALPDRVAALWTQAPPIDVQFGPALIERLATSAPNLSLPGPELVRFEKIEGQSPVPCLHFSSHPIQWWESPWGFRESGGPHGIRILLAHPSFRYGQFNLPANPSEPVTRVYHDDRTYIVSRDQAAENAAFQRLRQTGLRPVPEILNQPISQTIAAHWTLDSPSDQARLDFALQAVPALRAEGWIIEDTAAAGLDICQPDEWYLDPQPSPDNAWFDLELGILVGQERINLLPILLEGLRQQTAQMDTRHLESLPPDQPVAVSLPGGRTLGFPAGRLRAILSTLIELYDPQSLPDSQRLSVHPLRAAELSALATEDDWHWHGPDELRTLADRFRNLDGLPDVSPPAGLHATLRTYQLDGLRWLQFIRDTALGGVLADDMGLGKTVQTLSHLLLEKEQGRLDLPALVVCPTTLLVNWRDEAARFAPALRVLTLHGADRHERFADVAEADLILTTYSLLPRDAEKLTRSEFHAVILDEAQNIKNPKTLAAQVVCRIKARHRLCLTGTPIENHLGELWSLFHFLIPGFLYDEIRFRSLFRNPIEKLGDASRRRLLARRLKPFLVRRRKDQVALELPPKTEVVRKVELGGAQRDLYETIRLAMERRVRLEVERCGINRSHIIILDALLKLRQVCCDPRLVRLESARQVRDSAKLDLLLDLLPTMIEEGRRILLFSQFTSMLALIQEALADRTIPYALLTGDTLDRATPIRQFQSGEVPVFLLSLKAGGTGLNLTTADTVIHYDPWWNPAVETQATDRAHRIGQDKPVFVYRLLTVGTVEEKIEALQSRKRELVRGLLEEGASGALQLAREDIDFLFAPLS
ncbi:MAG: DEAD/DEAH box helicase [Verrucomicrobiae bacterium]|nr:DEAD/DEAH box helicase [Verrucomicrobiae bacterium]